MDNLITDNLGMVILYTIWTILCMASLWKIFEKSGQEGWYSLIPFFNVYIIFEKILRISWLNIFKALIPFYNIYFAIWLVKKWANAFGKTTAYAIGLIFMPYIFFPILAFGKAEYVYGKNNKTENNCTKCGDIINSNMKFCENCGTEIRRDTLDKKSSLEINTHPIKPKNKLVLIVLGVILVIGIAISNLFFINKSEEIVGKLNNEIAVMEKAKQVEKEKLNNSYQDNEYNSEEKIKESKEEKYPNGETKKIETRKIEGNILTIKETVYYEDGKKESERVSKYSALEDGKLIIYENQIPSLDSITFEDKEYYTSGNVKSNSNGKRLEDGVLKYISEEYYENGVLKEKKQIESEHNGETVLVYDIQMYYPSGNLLSKDIFNWEKSKVSTYIEYYENGKEKLIQKYIREYAEEDEIISSVKYNETGEEIKVKKSEVVEIKDTQLKTEEEKNNTTTSPNTQGNEQQKPKEKKTVQKCKNSYKGVERDQIVIIGNERKYVDKNGCII